MAANKFVVKGAGVEVDYTLGVTPGLPALVYKDGAFQKTFKSDQIQSDDTGLGEFGIHRPAPHRRHRWSALRLLPTVY